MACVCSRYDLASEINRMNEVVDAMPPSLGARIEHVFCDSKAGATYTVNISARRPLAEKVLDSFSSALIWLDRGYNGIYVEEFDDLYRDPDWGPDDGRTSSRYLDSQRRRWLYEAYRKTRFWAERREQVLKRCSGLCEECEMGPAEEVHHLSYENFGNENLDELRALCRPCHRRNHRMG
jgi:hypothetical protein